MSPINRDEILMEMHGRLARIEQSLKERSCTRHSDWLKNHETRIRKVELKVNTLWVAASFACGVFGFWLKSALGGLQ